MLIPEHLLPRLVWTTQSISKLLNPQVTESSLKATERSIQASLIQFEPLTDQSLADEHERRPKHLVLDQLIDVARKKRKLILFAQLLQIDTETEFLALNDARGGRRWIRLDQKKDSTSALREALRCLCDFEQKHIVIIPSGAAVASMRELVRANRGQLLVERKDQSVSISLEVYSHGHAEILQTANKMERPRACSLLLSTICVVKSYDIVFAKIAT